MFLFNYIYLFTTCVVCVNTDFLANPILQTNARISETKLNVNVKKATNQVRSGWHLISGLIDWFLDIGGFIILLFIIIYQINKNIMSYICYMVAINQVYKKNLYLWVYISL